MELFLAIILMIIGMILLIKGSDIFVDVGTHIGKMFKMNEILIGLTIVCVGTSLPELVTVYPLPDHLVDEPILPGEDEDGWVVLDGAEIV